MLLLAILLWFLVVTEKVFEDTFAIPINVIGIPSGRTLTMEIPKVALVRFHGRAKELLRLQYVNHPHVNVDLSGVTSGKSIKLKPESVIIPGGMNVTVVEILQPDSIITAMDGYAELMRPIVLNLDLGYAPGYTLSGEPVVHPESVLIFGPQKAVANIKEIHTEPIVLDNLSRTTEISTRLIIPTEKNVKMNLEQVKVVLRVERLGERELVAIPVKVITPPDDGTVYIEPPDIRATIRGSVSLLSDIETHQLKAWVDYSELDSKQPGWLPVHIEVPHGTELESITPSRIRVTIRR